MNTEHALQPLWMISLIYRFSFTNRRKTQSIHIKIVTIPEKSCSTFQKSCSTFLEKLFNFSRKTLVNPGKGAVDRVDKHRIIYMTSALPNFNFDKTTRNLTDWTIEELP